MAATHAKASSTSSTPAQRTFVLDTSVLLSDPHAMMRFDLSAGFPAVTTKRLAFRSVVAELLWFLAGSSDVNDLHALGVRIDALGQRAGERGERGLGQLLRIRTIGTH